MKFIVKLMAIQPDGAADTEDFALNSTSAEEAIRETLNQTGALELEPTDTLAIYAQPVSSDTTKDIIFDVHSDPEKWFASGPGGKRALSPKEKADTIAIHERRKREAQ